MADLLDVVYRHRCRGGDDGKALSMDAILPYFQVLPFAEIVFQNFTFSGWALLIVNGSDQPDGG